MYGPEDHCVTLDLFSPLWDRLTLSFHRTLVHSNVPCHTRYPPSTCIGGKSFKWI